MPSLMERIRAALRQIAPSLLFAALCVPGIAAAQLPEPLPTPNLALWTNGSVNAITRAKDGSIVFGGNFSAVNGTSRRNLARLLPNGELDLAFNTGTNSSVNAIVVDSAGSIFVGGFFTEIGGQPRNRIAKLDQGGFVDVSWAPDANDSVDALALQGNGSLFVGGTFTMIDGVSRGRLAKVAVAAGGTLDPDWNPNVGGSVIALAYDATADALYLGGDFNVVELIPRASIAKVSGSGSGTVDASWDPGADDVVTSLQLGGAGLLYAGGYFGSFDSQPHTRIARVDTATGIADPGFAPLVTGGDVFSIALDTDRVYIAGSFTEVNATPRASLARISTINAALDASFNPVINAAVNEVASFGDGIVYIGGSQFTDIDGLARLGFAALDASGSALAAIDVWSPGAVFTMVVLPDGNALVGGDFSFVGFASHRNLFKLSAAGQVVAEFDAGTDGPVRSLTLEMGGGSVYATGTFLNANGVSRPSLAKFATAASGALDLAWHPAPAGGVRTVAVAADNAVYVGGSFSEIAGNLRDRIAKLSGSTGALMVTWGVAGADDAVNKLAVAPNGSVFASGFFNQINGQARMGLAKLDAVNGAADPGWIANLDANRFARSMVFSNGAMYVGGGFASIGGIARASLAKVSIGNPAVVDASWAPAADGEVEALAIGANDALFVVGGFTTINGLERQQVAKLSMLGSGAPDPIWAPDVAGSYVSAVAIDANLDVLIGGSFNMVGTQFRQGIAALPQVVTLPDALFKDGFE